jgi:hypothetical protein
VLVREIHVWELRRGSLCSNGARVLRKVRRSGYVIDIMSQNHLFSTHRLTQKCSLHTSALSKLCSHVMKECMMSNSSLPTPPTPTPNKSTMKNQIQLFGGPKVPPMSIASPPFEEEEEKKNARSKGRKALTRQNKYQLHQTPFADILVRVHSGGRHETHRF